MYAYGRTAGSSGCEGWATKVPTPVSLGGHSAGGTYSVVEEADHDYSLSSPNFGVSISTNSICWTNRYVSTFVETWDYGDALGGSVDNHFNFSARQFKTSAGGAWMTLPTKCNTRTAAADPPFKCLANSGVLETWTSR
jgi:hypothetical protein